MKPADVAIRHEVLIEHCRCQLKDLSLMNIIKKL
jgi:hypothetical protein